MSFLKSHLSPLILTLGLAAFSSQATIVEFQTSQGNFKVNLHDETTPKTVENFLKYVTDGDYNETVFHRSVSNFVIQAGGYSLNDDLELAGIDIDDPVINEPVYSNVRGTIAMAKRSGDINSATSQWFFNLNDNGSSQRLDYTEGGYSVFWGGSLG